MTLSTKPRLLALCLGAQLLSGILTASPSNVTSPSPTPVAPPSTQAPLAPPTHINGVNASCTPLNLSAATWNQLQLDKYLANYPNGQNLTLAQYGDALGAQNFRCGIEEFCSCGQMCNPLRAPDWYIFLAVQEWNNVMNSVYKAVHYATTSVQGTLAMMVSGLADRNLKAETVAFDVGALAALCASLAAVIGLGISTLMWVGYVGILYESLVAFGYTSLAMGGLSSVGLATSSLLGMAPPDKKSFMKWSFVGNAFSAWEIKMHSMISNTTQAVINSPISSPAGISGVVRGGAFLYEAQSKSTSDLQIQYETVLQARSLVLVLRAMGAYVTRGSEKCDQKGPNGARSGDEFLSFCGPDKVMMNVVLARKNKTKNKIINANWVASKFGFTTEYIVTQSWNCQQKYHQFQFDPYLHAALPSDPNADCVINLPVCDLTDMKIASATKGHHHHVTKACRAQGGLPI